MVSRAAPVQVIDRNGYDETNFIIRRFDPQVRGRSIYEVNSYVSIPKALIRPSYIYLYMDAYSCSICEPSLILRSFLSTPKASFTIH